jgi:hypothetical protein
LCGAPFFSQLTICYKGTNGAEEVAQADVDPGSTHAIEAKEKNEGVSHLQDNHVRSGNTPNTSYGVLVVALRLIRLFPGSWTSVMPVDRVTVTSAGPSNQIVVLNAPFNVSSPTNVCRRERLDWLYFLVGYFRWEGFHSKYITLARRQGYMFECGAGNDGKLDIKHYAP